MYREIIAKTLTGKGKYNQVIEKNIYINDQISKTLGCWIINLKTEISRENQDVFINGSFDVQLWYASDNNQKSEVYNETINFKEKVIMSYRDLKVVDEEMEIKIYTHKYPSCTFMELDENKNIKLIIEGLYYLDAFQEAVLVVSCNEEYIEDLSLEEEIIMNVNPNYLTNEIIENSPIDESK